MACQRMFISLLSLFVLRSVAYRIQTVSKFWQDEEISVKAWTWNSGKADLTEEAKRLAKTSAEVIVTCQTEATKGIHHFMPEEWQLVAHGEHWGAAGGAINAQMSSVFVRKPLDGSKFVGNVSEIIGRKPWRSDIGNVGTFGLVGSGVESPLISAQAQVTALDYKGKGGVSTSLDFHKNQARDGFMLQFVCAHLDSEKEEARHYGIGQMLAEARARDLQRGTALRKEVVGKQGEVREPSRLYTALNVSDNAWGPLPDAVLLFGDLNFRLSAEGIENISQVLFLDSEGRKMLAKNDRLSHLNPHYIGDTPTKKHLDVLVTPEKEKGFGFKCNEPFELYPPTYKRKGGEVQLEKEVPFENWEKDLEKIKSRYSYLGYQVFNVTGAEIDVSLSGTSEWRLLRNRPEEFPLTVKTLPHEACSTMGKALHTCGGILQPPCKDWVYELAAHCYVRKDKKTGLTQWAQKKSDLQLGWLDRFCWRTTGLKTLGVSLITEEGWMEYPEAKEKDGGSDHMPIAGTFRFTTVQCSCFKDLVGTKLFIPECQEHRHSLDTKILLGGDSYIAECEPGYALSDGTHSTTLTCGRDGTLQPFTQCLKICDWNEKNWPRFIRPRTLLAGDEIRLTCRNSDDQLLGVPDVKCNAYGGIVPVDHQQIPVCVGVCKLPDQEDVVITEKQLASSDLLAKYGDELKAKWGMLRDVLLQGGKVRYACRNDCVSVGGTVTSCGGTRSETDPNPVKCGCNIRLVVKEMTFDDPKLADQIEKVKLQAYRGPLSQEKLEDLRGNKGYKAATKFTMEDLKSEEPNENLEIDIPKPANTELHFTLCSKARRNPIFAFRSCSVLAFTSNINGMMLQELLQLKDSYDGEVRFSVPLEMKAGGKSPRVDVKLQYHLSK